MCQSTQLSDEEYFAAPSSTSTSGFFSCGKRSRRGSSLTPGPTLHHISSLSSTVSSVQEGALSVFCRRLQRPLLVDNGADVSVFPASAAQKQSPPSSVLRAANGTTINTFGHRAISLALPGLSVKHKFLLADVRRPIPVSYTHLTLPTILLV